MSFFDPFLRDSDSPGPDAVFDPAGPKSPNQLSSSFVSFSSDWGGKQGASFYQSATSEWNGSPSDQFDLKAFHLHRRDQASSGSAPHSGHTASNHENTGSSVPGVSGHSGEFDTQSLGRKGGSRGQQRSGVGVEGDAEEILTSTTTSSGNSGTEHHGDEEVRRCPGTGVVSGPSREALEQEAQREPFRFIDFEVVPCSPVEELPRLAFLCPTAEAEVQKKMRPDVVRPSDLLQLPLYQAELLLNHGKAKVKFPPFYEPGIIGSLTIDPLAVNLATHSLFYFELGLYLCKMLPAYEWPVQHLQEILRNAWHRRRIHIITNSIALSKDFVDGLTFSEVCTLSELREGETGPCGPFGY